MGSNHLELEDFITFELVEEAHRQANKALEARNRRFAEIGWRAARNGDSKLLKALEKGAELIDKASEAQMGETRRSMRDDIPESWKVPHTEASLWREAYVTADRGTPVENLMWIYGAGAWLCGYNRS